MTEYFYFVAYFTFHVILSLKYHLFSVISKVKILFMISYVGFGLNKFSLWNSLTEFLSI